eukprot:9473232-Pyramimonas_sp.AAC.1
MVSIPTPPQQDVCTVAWHCTRAGLRGLGDLACDPAGSAHRTHHIREALGMNKNDAFYTTEVPMWDSDTQARIYSKFPVSLPHETFSSTYEANPSDYDLRRLGAQNVPPHFENHAVKLMKGDLAFPVGYYSDG